jgi:hypothetical protein
MQGSCLCGAVRFEVTPPLRSVVACHCSQCRKTSGHYWAASSVPLAGFRLLTETGLAWYRASATARRGFCRLCGSTLFWQPDDGDRISFSPGALDEPSGLRIDRHIFVADKGDYYTLGDGAPQHAEDG